MQTFLPYASFSLSMTVLDAKRLGKQRVEARQLLEAIRPGSTSGWRNHPAAKMWRGHEEALIQYGNAAIREWVARGYQNTMPVLPARNELWLEFNGQMPSWYGAPEFHAAHRSNLLRKNPAFYAHFQWQEPSNLPYLWPVPA